MTGHSDVTWTIGPTSGDPEIDAMRQMLVVLGPLDPHARSRVLRWLIERDGLTHEAER